MPVALGVRRLRALLDQRRVIFPRGLYDALPNGSPRAESGHNGTVIQKQHDHVGVGFVEVVTLRKLFLSAPRDGHPSQTAVRRYDSARFYAAHGLRIGAFGMQQMHRLRLNRAW